HRIILRHMISLVERSAPIDLVTLQEELLRAAQLEGAGGMAYLASLLDGIPHLINVDPYIEIIREKSLFRQMVNAMNKIMGECFDQASPAEEVLDRAEKTLFDLSERRMKVGFVSVRELEASTTRLLEKLYNEREMITGVATGFVDLDRMTSGLQRSDLVILAARPSMGKTALCLNIAQHVALHKRAPVGMFSLEMSKEQLLMRMLCAESRVDAHKVRTGYLSKEDFRKLIDTLGVTTQAPLYIDDSSTLTVM